MNKIPAAAAATVAIVSVSAPAFADALPWTPPPGVEKVSPCIPKMDTHWADMKTLPLGPWYNVHDGKLIAIEYAVSVEDFVAGKNFTGLSLQFGGKAVDVDHVDITLAPKGHPHFEKPHYDLHFYLISVDEEDKITCK